MRRRPLAAMLLVVLITAFLGPGTATAAAPSATPRHVFVIVLENESASTTFGASSPAPYLSRTLTAAGAYVPNYYGVGHNSNDNYIAMISGQAPNIQTQADCQGFVNVIPGTVGADGQAQGTGCIYPATVPTIASQLTASGFTWRDYNESMGADPTREPTVCAHPGVGAQDNTQTATVSDNYATRHNPFVYFHGIIDDGTLCDTHVVGLDAMPQDLSSPATTSNYSFITPDLCNDGHDAPCKNGQPGGLAQADSFLKTWVPKITASPAFRADGLLMIVFDEASTSDASACCGERPGPGSPLPGVTGPGGGRTGAVFLSPCIAPGTVTNVAYNHYSMLASVENIFGLSHLAAARAPGLATFGADLFNRSCGPAPPRASVSAPSLQSTVSTGARIRLRWQSNTAGGTNLAGYSVRVRDLGARGIRWRTLAARTQSTTLTYRAALGHTYAFSVTAVNLAGQLSAPAVADTLVPSGVHPANGRYGAGWQVRRVRGAWQGQAITSARPGARFLLRYSGGSLFLIGERGPGAGALSVAVDGHARIVRLHAAQRRTRQVIFRMTLKPRAHRLAITVMRGPVALEGVAIAARQS